MNHQDSTPVPFAHESKGVAAHPRQDQDEVLHHALRFLLLASLLSIPSLGVAFAQTDTFTLSSPDLEEGGALPEAQVLTGFGCEGPNVSPALSWQNAPEGTESFAVTVYDPDAATGSGWWHWVVFDIPTDVTGLEAGAGSEGGTMPEGSVQSTADAGVPGYGGACPPEGDAPHRYVFTAYALGTASLGLNTDASGAMVGLFLNANSLARGSITVTYGR